MTMMLQTQNRVLRCAHRFHTMPTFCYDRSKMQKISRSDFLVVGSCLNAQKQKNNSKTIATRNNKQQAVTKK
jgi:hypothetical protein